MSDAIKSPQQAPGMSDMEALEASFADVHAALEEARLLELIAEKEEQIAHIEAEIASKNVEIAKCHFRAVEVRCALLRSSREQLMRVPESRREEARQALRQALIEAAAEKNLPEDHEHLEGALSDLDGLVLPGLRSVEGPVH